MKTRSSILISIIICMVVIGLSYYWAVSLMDSVYDYRSPLTNSPPVPGGSLGTPNTRSLVFVLIDALRYDTSLKSDVMPFLNSLRTEGASALMHSRPPSYSQAGYTTLLTGAWSDINDGPIINLDYSEIPTFTQDDIFLGAHRAGLFTAISAFNWFEKMVPQGSVTESFYTAGEDQVADRQVTDAAIPWLRQGKYQLVLIHLDQVDYAGHYEGGPMDPRWNAAANRVDGLLSEIASAMDLTQDTLLIVSDHGHINQGGHGGQDPIVLQEPFVMAGKAVVHGKYNDAQMVDVAPTVAVLLGINIPATNEGHPRVDMFDFSLEQVSKIYNALSVQQGQLAVAYETAIGRPVSVTHSSDVVAATQAAMDTARELRLNSQRIPRGIVAIILMIAIINLTAWHARPHATWLFGGIVSYLVIFNIKYLLIDHKTYSLSSVKDATSLVVSPALTIFIALGIGWFLVLLGTRAYRFRPKQAADTTLKYVLVMLSVLAIPIAISYFLNGAIVTWTLPDFLTSFLGLIFLIQIIMVAAIGLVLTGFSAIIGAFGHDR